MNVPEKAPRGRFRYRRYGVYDLTYEDAAPPPFTLRIYLLLDGLRVICEEIPYVARQLVDTIKLAPAEFVAYMVTSVWLGVYSAVNLYWLSVLLDRLGDGFTNSALAPNTCWSLAISWISCVLVNIAAERTFARSLEVLTTRFRAQFIPRLIRASLRVDLLSIQDLYTVFPVEGRFWSEYPGGLFLQQLRQLIRCNLALVSQVFVLLNAISHKQSPEREVLLSFCVARGLVWWLAPSSGIGNEAYVYWPNNRHFQRMKTLFGFAFSTQYRADLVLDGITSIIETEYKKSAEQLGNVDVLDPTPWRADILRDWYWDFLMTITLDFPLVIYTLMHPAYLSLSSVASMVFLQKALGSISLGVGQYNEGTTPSLLDICSQAKRFYDAIDYQSTMPQGTEPFPCPIDKSRDTGMKISFRDVSLRYPESDHHALHNVSFNILPGELVLVVGTNGSGKSSMLKLLARLFDPTAGEILVDDMPLVRYDVDQFRAAVAFQSQSPAVYPVNVRENIAFGLRGRDVCDSEVEAEQARVEVAAQMGRCADWIARLGDGYDTQLQPSFDIDDGWTEGMYGNPSKALQEELARHRGRPVPISDGEKQRLATARTLMRIANRPTRLVVVDEATSSLDPVAERDILTAFREVRAGKTVVLVTHRFHRLVHEADQILCMKDGCVVENGTHADLVRANGDYAALYHAQVEWNGSS